MHHTTFLSAESWSGSRLFWKRWIPIRITDPHYGSATLVRRTETCEVTRTRRGRTWITCTSAWTPRPWTDRPWPPCPMPRPTPWTSRSTSKTSLPGTENHAAILLMVANHEFNTLRTWIQQLPQLGGPYPYQGSQINADPSDLDSDPGQAFSLNYT